MLKIIGQQGRSKETSILARGAIPIAEVTMTKQCKRSQPFLSCIFSVALICSFLVSDRAAAAPQPLFQGGWQDAHGDRVWGIRFGTFAGDVLNIYGVSGVPVLPPNAQFAHAEAQRLSYIGADFTYSAEINLNPDAEAHPQFRISDYGRYGVRTRRDSITLYRFLRGDEPCSTTDAGATSHCPAFPDSDNPIYTELITCTFGSAGCSCPAPNPNILHQVSVTAQANFFAVTLDGVQCMAFFDQLAGNQLLSGRFGIYVYGLPGSLNGAIFRNVSANYDPNAKSNFALLYSTAGYELNATKRALVRTLNDLPATMFDPAGFTFTVSQGPKTVLTGALTPLLEPNSSILAKTYGMQLFEADFSSIKAPGAYTLQVSIRTVSSSFTLSSLSFNIASHLFTGELLDAISTKNALARRAADEDMRRNWCFENTTNGCTNNPAFGPQWSVTEDGAFYADRADSGAGAVLRRVSNQNNGALDPAMDFHYVGEVAIISGCDAQMQFAVTAKSRWAVTLQAGAPGGCAFGGGPGAVRISYEDGSGFHIVTAALFPAGQPFVPGHPYDVDITVHQGIIDVLVDGGVVQLLNVQGPQAPLGFALKAWASTARFRRVQAWSISVPLKKSSDFTRIPYYLAKLPNRSTEAVPCQFWLIPKTAPVDKDLEDAACNPYFAQFSGFQDCNNFIGEATSHGAFLDGLMEIWTRRASAMTQTDRELLRWAIITNALYIEGLYQEGGETGEFAHSEMGRAGVNTNLGDYQSEGALYGESAFADEGQFVDPRLAKLACSRSIQGVAWLAQHNFADDTQRSIFYAHIARCTAQFGLPGSDGYWNQAITAAQSVISYFANPGHVAGQQRDAGRVFPWFEGAYEVMKSHPLALNASHPQLQSTADLLVNHLASNHVCDDSPSGPICPKNGFLVLPAASGDVSDFVSNWNDMQSVPRAERSLSSWPYINFFSIPPFIVAASDSVYLGMLTRMATLEPVATGNLNWSLGLNPGVPASKSAIPIDYQPWQSASFTYNGIVTSVRTMDGWRTPESSSKGWLSLPREVSAASPRHETWWIDPGNNGFTSLVNGHVIWDNQWDYINGGDNGWLSGETFLLDDGVFIKAALLYEDWLGARVSQTANPYANGKLAFFDTTHIDRLSTNWVFDDPDTTEYAQAARASTDFCDEKGFNGGRFTGHYIGERAGLLCTPNTASFFDIGQPEINATGWGFTDINSTDWAQIARAATTICNNRGFVGGYFTGHQLNGLHGVVCLKSDVAHWFDATAAELQSSGFGFSDINSVPWAQAARAATNICLSKSYSGGFFTGNQLNGLHGVVCLGP